MIAYLTQDLGGIQMWQALIAFLVIGIMFGYATS